MVIRIFKLITLTFLGVAFVYLLNHRDFSITPTNKSFTTKTSLNTLSKEDSEDASVNKDLSQTKAPVTNTAPTTNVISSTSNEQQQYIKLEEGASDTEEGYTPTISACKKPVGYKLGRFDTQFGITKEQFLSEISYAVNVWGDAATKKLFYYDEQGSLTINLIYDERQATTNDISYLALDIENAKESATQLKTTYQKETATYDTDGKIFTDNVEAFNTRYESYKAKVTMYNNQGGAPSAEYATLTEEQQRLKEEAARLDIEQKRLSALREKINQEVTRYNEFVTYINTLIKKSNSIGARKFTEGRFVPSTNTVDIYQYNNEIKLRRVLLHEFGHVLGIDHLNSTASIMYSVNVGTSTLLSREDRAALLEVCEH